jgi:hypothetical protein
VSWTYTLDPENSSRDEIRFLIGDTNEDDPQLQDEEIAYALSKFTSNAYNAAALCCRTLASKYARLADTTIDEVSVSASQKYRHYLTLAVQLEQQGESALASSLGAPYVGGVSVSNIESVEGDTDRNEPAFRTKMFNNPPGSSEGDLTSGS